MKKLLLVVLAVFLGVSMLVAQEQKENFVLNMLATAKMTGACGMVYQLLQFQAVTRMEGGDKFVVRFLKTEAARLGMTDKKYMETCNAATAMYNEFWRLAEKETK